MITKSRKKKVVAIIPARMRASRFPGKPLAKILELPLVEHVRRRTSLSEVIDEAIVATCDEEIKEAVESYGGKAMMTANSHERCTDRVEEAAKNLDSDIVVMVQGDEPLFFPEVLNALVRPLLKEDPVDCTNVLSIIHDQADLQQIDIVKTVLNEQKNVLYFSRSPIPYARVRSVCPMYRQTGIAAFRKEFLHQFSKLTPTALEIAESVDFLRILGHGYLIRGVLYDQITQGVDRLEDIKKVESVLQQNPEQQALYQKIRTQ